MKLPRLLSSLAMAGLVLAGCGRDEAPPAALAPPVRIAEIGPAEFASHIVASGLVRAATETPLAFKTPGIVAALRVSAGQTVKSGQVLAELNATDLDAALAQAREALAKQERDLGRAESLRVKGMISQQAEQDVRAQRDVARANLAAAEFNRRNALILAPADGVVLEKRVEARETVAAGQPILVLGQLAQGWVVKAGLPPRDALQVRIGDEVGVRVDAETIQVAGRLTRIAAASDPRTGTVEIEVALPTKSLRLVSGMVAHLSLSAANAPKAKTLAVPIGALIEGTDGTGKLFVLESSGDKVKRIVVRTGRLFDGRIEVLEGLSPGTKVVSEGAAWLTDGGTVRVLP